MTKRVRPRMTVAGALAVLALGAAPEAAVAAEDVTYTADVAPILYENCLVCHRPGQVAPMAFRDYAETRPWARAIKDKVVSGEMPPWFADPQYGAWLNDRRLSREEIDTITAWVDAGAPLGDAADLPEPPAFSDNWALGDMGDPDLNRPDAGDRRGSGGRRAGLPAVLREERSERGPVHQGDRGAPRQPCRRAPRRDRHGAAPPLHGTRRPRPDRTDRGLRAGRRRPAVRLRARELQADRLRSRQGLPALSPRHRQAHQPRLVLPLRPALHADRHSPDRSHRARPLVPRRGGRDRDESRRW